MKVLAIKLLESLRSLMQEIMCRVEMSVIKLIFLPHTHWDREWYLPFEVFREKLVEVIDELTEVMGHNSDYKYFLLDGQTIVLEDYLEIKGENPQLLKLIKEGRIGIGPWYVLPDEFLVTGESIIRNLKRGFDLARKFGREPVKVGYLPDMFGHISQMPQILRGFGIDSAIVWRGVPLMKRNHFLWQSREGSSVLAMYLPTGYGFIFNLPNSGVEFLKGLNFFLFFTKARDESGVYMLPIGTDHWALETGLPKLIKGVSELEKDWKLEIGKLEDYFEQLKPNGEGIPSYLGELRSNEQALILPSVASARLYLKEMNHRASALIEKYLEPIATLAKPGVDIKNEMDYLWKLILSNHPHDSICGCSVDEVHQEMETRYKKKFQLGEYLLGKMLARITKFENGENNYISIWNPNPSTSPAVIFFENEVFAPQNLILEDKQGRKYPLEMVSRIQTEELLYQMEFPSAISWVVFNWFSAEQLFGYYTNFIRTRREGEKLWIELHLGSKPMNYPVKAELARIQAMIGKEKISQVALQIYRKPSYQMVAVIDELDGPGLSTFQVKKRKVKFKSELTRSESGLENKWLKLRIDEAGKIRVLEKDSGKEILVEFSDRADAGDSYNFEPLKNDTPITKPEKFRFKFGPSGKKFATVDLVHFYHFPVALDSSRNQRSKNKTVIILRTRIYLYSGLRRVDFETNFENKAKDHRLQVDFWYPELLDSFWAESGFDLVKRKIEPEALPSQPAEISLARLAFGSEANYATSPIQNFGLLENQELSVILAGRGLKEIVAEQNQENKRTRLSFTLCRAIGYLSRANLSFRTGLAGPPLETPEAQCLRKFSWNYSLLFFRPPHKHHPVFAFAYNFVFPPLAFPGKVLTTIPFQLNNPKIILSALYPSPEGKIIARFFNSGFQNEKIEIKLDDKVVKVKEVNLEEKVIPQSTLEVKDKTIIRELKPGEITTLSIEVRGY